MSLELIVPQLEKACILVTLAFVLTRTRLFGHLLRRRLPVREQAIAVLLLLVLGLVEVAISPPDPNVNLRIVAAAVAGLIAGPWVGVFIGVAVTEMSYLTGHEPLPIAISMVAAGLVGGLIHGWNPKLAVSPITGFFFGAATSFARDGLVIAAPLVTHGSPTNLPLTWYEPLMHGVSVALILLVIEQVRQQEGQARAAAMSEVRALQARMDPHFLFNALNTLSALSTVDPGAVPTASARLGTFLRASLDRHERPLIPLEEELDVVRAYVEIERLRLGDRLTVEQEVEPGLLEALVPPFVLQPLVENAICHGIQPEVAGGVVRITAHAVKGQVTLCVSDNGAGITPEERDRLFPTDGGQAHALGLLRLRLQRLYGSGFRLTIESCRGEGTKVSIRIPLSAGSSYEDFPEESERAAEAHPPIDEGCTAVLLRER